MKSVLYLLSVLVCGAAVVAFVLPKATGKKGTSRFTKAQVDRGAYLVMAGGCNDCHSPKIMTKDGPAPDQSRLLSGAPEEEPVPEIPQGVIGPGKWLLLSDDNTTTWVGPWGVSFSANLTPDSATGIGAWTKEVFIQSLRKGKYWGNGRDLLPPMPWQEIGQMTNTDLTDIYAYLMTLNPVHNVVHAPLPPDEAFHH